MVREIRPDELEGLLTLYMQLHGNPFPEDSEQLRTLWQRIVEDPDHHIIVAEEDGRISVRSCT